MEALTFVVNHILFIVFVVIVISLISLVLKKDFEVVYKYVRWMVNSAIGGLIMYFILATFLDYFGYLE